MTTRSRGGRVLVLTLSFGAGHGRAAAAIAYSLRAEAPDAEVQVVDALEHARLWFRAIYVWPYWAMLRWAPGLWRAMFEARLRHRTRQTAPAWLFQHGCRHAFQTIASFQPDVIVAAEVGAGEIAAIARRLGITSGSIAGVITDRQAEPAWVAPEVDVYAVADAAVCGQLQAWGAPRQDIAVCGIPTAAHLGNLSDPVAATVLYGGSADRPLVLLMAGGMGPSRMDRIAAGLCASGCAMHVVAVAGRDARVRRRLARVQPGAAASLRVCGWIDDVPALMRAASVLVTKPGGVSTAEAAICGAPMVLFDPIPGPEERNAAAIVEAGAAVLSRGADDTVAAVLSLLANPATRADMAAASRRLARPEAADSIARLVLERCAGAGDQSPVLILTIGNGAGHTAVAEAVGESIKAGDSGTAVRIVDVADYMSPLLRATHVTLFLWLVTHAPRVWERIDAFQKRQPRTSPDWHYRRGCRRLFGLVRALQPRAIVATEVGCCEIAALIKRDLGLDCPLVAVNGEYDADRAWVQPEVQVYSVADSTVRDAMFAHGADPGRVHAWGVPLAPAFQAAARSFATTRAAVCVELGLRPGLPIVLVSGGSEGLGRPDRVAERILGLAAVTPQVIVLAGRNASLRRRCERLGRGAGGARLRVLGWTRNVAPLMQAADLLVSKLGHTFDEAMAAGLPVVSPEPPPGSERVQYQRLAQWGVGRAVRGLDEMAATVERLLTGGAELAAMRGATARLAGSDASGSIARWLRQATVAAPSGARVSEVVEAERAAERLMPAGEWR